MSARFRVGWVGMLLAAALAAGVTWRTTLRRGEPSLRRASLAQLEERARRSPDDPRLFLALGRRYGQMAQPAAAVAAFERAAALSDDAEIYVGWASAVPDAQAVTILNTYLAEHPDSAPVHLVLARLYQRRDDPAHSFEYAARAAQLDGRSPEVWHLKGSGALAVNLLAEAENSYRRAIALEPKNPSAHLGLGAALTQQNRAREGLASLRRAAALDPRNGVALLALGQVESDAAQSPGEMEAARQHLREALRLRPNLAAAHLYLGQSSVKMGRPREALDDLKRARASLPDDPAVYFALAQAHRGLGDAAQARRTLQRHKALRDYQQERTSLLLRAGTGADPDLLLHLARLATKHGAYQSAITAYRNALAQNPQDPRITRELAALQRRGGR